MRKNRDMTAHVTYSSVDDIIEQQTHTVDGKYVEPIIHNPLRPDVLWDVDDNWEAFATGRVGKGEVFTYSMRFIADTRSHLFNMTGGLGRKREFIMRLRIPEISFQYEQTFAGSGAFCLLGPSVRRDDPRVQDIEGSNGGRGILSTAIFEIVALDKSNKTGFFFRFHYPSLGAMDAICRGREMIQMSESPSWYLVR